MTATLAVSTRQPFSHLRAGFLLRRSKDTRVRFGTPTVRRRMWCRAVLHESQKQSPRTLETRLMKIQQRLAWQSQQYRVARRRIETQRSCLFFQVRTESHQRRAQHDDSPRPSDIPAETPP